MMLLFFNNHSLVCLQIIMDCLCIKIFVQKDKKTLVLYKIQTLIYQGF